MSLPEHIRFLKLSYTVNGAISELLSEKAITSMLIPTFNETLIKVVRQYDQATVGVEQAEQWYKLRVHRVHLNKYLTLNGL